MRFGYNRIVEIHITFELTAPLITNSVEYDIIQQAQLPYTHTHTRTYELHTYTYIYGCSSICVVYGIREFVVCVKEK